MTGHQQPFSSEVFTAAMGSFPAGVVIAATLDGQQQPWGFTATSFSSVSMAPPLVLVCLATTASCHDVFSKAEHWSINILRSGDEALATRLATRGAAKFSGDEFASGPEGMPLVRNAMASLVCRRHAAHEAGDHLVLIGEVQSIDCDSSADAMVYWRRRFLKLEHGGT